MGVPPKGNPPDYSTPPDATSPDAIDTSPVPTLAEVRAALAAIPGDLTADFISERDER